MASSYDYYGQGQQQQQQRLSQPSPYMSSSSAGNPASSYGSSGGSQAGYYGTPAPTYSAPTQSFAQQKQTQGAQVQGYRAPAGANPNYPYASYTYGQQPPSPEGTYQAGLYAAQPRAGAPSQYTSSSQQQQGFQAPFQAQQQQQAQQAYAPFQNPSQFQNTNPGIWNPNFAPRYNPQTGQWEMPSQPQGPLYQQNGQPIPPNVQQGQPPPGGYDTRFPQGTPPPQNADTNGYQMPRLSAPPVSRFAMPGWDNGKWNDMNNQDPKYVAGRILSGIPARTDQMDIATARIAAAYPGTTRVGNGDINIPGVGTIDILMGAGAGGRGWWWGAGQQGGGAASGADKQFPTTQDPMGYESLIKALMQPGQQMMAQAPQAAYDITKDPQYLKLQQQLASMQTQQQTWQAEQAAAARQGGGVNHPSFAYY